MYNIKNRDSTDLQQQLRESLEEVAKEVKEALEEEYAHESKLIDEDGNKSTDEKIQAHRQSLGDYILGTCAISFFLYCAYIVGGR